MSLPFKKLLTYVTICFSVTLSGNLYYFVDLAVAKFVT